MSSQTTASRIQQAHKRLLDVVEGEVDLRGKLSQLLVAQENYMKEELIRVREKAERIDREQECLRRELLELPGSKRIDVRRYC
jgi:hypothetical protein